MIEIVPTFPGSKPKKRSSIARKASNRLVRKSSTKKRTKRRKGSITVLKRKLDAVFSKFIRERDKHTCFTCGLVMDPKKSQNGHFVPRQYLAVRWDETNNHAQCYACNIFYNGQPGAYAVRLENDYGVGTVARLEGMRKNITKLTPEWYLEKIAHYQNIVNNFTTPEESVQ